MEATLLLSLSSVPYPKCAPNGTFMPRSLVTSVPSERCHSLKLHSPLENPKEPSQFSPSALALWSHLNIILHSVFVHFFYLLLLAMYYR